MEVVSADMSNDIIAKAVMKSGMNDDREEELCQLVVNILFTVMWRGLQVSDKYTNYFFTVEVRINECILSYPRGPRMKSSRSVAK